MVLSAATEYDRATVDRKSAVNRPVPKFLSDENKKELEQVRRLYLRGRQAIEAENYVEALKIFLVTDRIKGNDPRIQNMIAYCYRKLGKLDEAFKYAEWALRADPDFAEARVSLMETHIQAALVQLRLLQSYDAEGGAGVKDLKAAFRAAMVEMDRPPPDAAPSQRPAGNPKK